MKLGEVVYSKAGRDKNKKFIIFEIIDDAYVLIVDGEFRKVEKPKKKKNKHLVFTNDIIESLNKKLLDKIKIINAEVGKELKLYESLQSC